MIATPWNILPLSHARLMLHATGNPHWSVGSTKGGSGEREARKRKSAWLYIPSHLTFEQRVVIENDFTNYKAQNLTRRGNLERIATLPSFVSVPGKCTKMTAGHPQGHRPPPTHAVFPFVIVDAQTHSCTAIVTLYLDWCLIRWSKKQTASSDV